MAKKSSKKAAKPLETGQAPKPAETGYPVEQADLDAQNARLKKAAAAGVQALKPTSAAQTPAVEPVRATNPQVAPKTPSPRILAANEDASITSQRASGSADATIAKPSSPPGPSSARQAAVAVPNQPNAPRKAAAIEKLPTPTAAKKVQVRFALLDPAAKKVWLRGGFNSWSPDANPMTRHADGHWETTLALEPGRYEYKFFVDGHWIPDPAARDQVWNQHGTLNSVIEVRA